MEPRKDESEKAPKTGEKKERRFQIVKLEERIAPSKGGNGTNNSCGYYGCGGGGGYSHPKRNCWF